MYTHFYDPYSVLFISYILNFRFEFYFHPFLYMNSLSVHSILSSSHWYYLIHLCEHEIFSISCRQLYIMFVPLDPLYKKTILKYFLNIKFSVDYTLILSISGYVFPVNPFYTYIITYLSLTC